MIDRTEIIAKDFPMNHFRLFLTAALALTLLPLATVDAGEAGPFRHFVSFQFKDGVTAQQKEEIVKEFLGLPGKISTIVALEWGETENIEPRNDGYTHSFLVSFEDRDGLAVYLPHEAHQAFVAKLRPLLEKAYVFDYTAKSSK